MNRTSKIPSAVSERVAKRLGTRWGVLAVSAGLVAMTLVTPRPAPAQEGAEELLENPGFDQERDGQGLPRDWSVSRDRILWRETVYLSKNYELVSRPDAYVLASQGIKLEPGQRYTIRLTLKGEGGALGGALIVHGEEKPTREMPLLWNIQPSAEYETYVGTFVAPNPVAQLLIYNVARKGTIAYDRISLREGEPDEPIISQLSLREIGRPLGEVPETRHIDWASPLAGGPVKTCFTLRTFLLMRDAAELAQRIDLDYDVIHTGYEGDECVSDTARRATKRMGEGSYEVYVVASRLSNVLTKTIRQRVEAGAGLVVLEGFGQGNKLLPAGEWKTVDDSHCLRAGIPWERMPEKILASVQTGEIGKGRAVRLAAPHLQRLPPALASRAVRLLESFLHGLQALRSPGPVAFEHATILQARRLPWLRSAPKVTVTRERVSLCQKGVTRWLLFLVNCFAGSKRAKTSRGAGCEP